MYSSAPSTSSGVNCGQTLCGDILTAELLAGDVGVVPEASGAICLTSF